MKTAFSVITRIQAMPDRVVSSFKPQPEQGKRV
jgi:hypothetical protein